MTRNDQKGSIVNNRVNQQIQLFAQRPSQIVPIHGGEGGREICQGVFTRSRRSKPVAYQRNGGDSIRDIAINQSGFRFCNLQTKQKAENEKTGDSSRIERVFHVLAHVVHTFIAADETSSLEPGLMGDRSLVCCIVSNRFVR